MALGRKDAEIFWPGNGVSVSFDSLWSFDRDPPLLPLRNYFTCTSLSLNVVVRVDTCRPVYRVPESELSLSGAGKTRRHQHVVITDER